MQQKKISTISEFKESAIKLLDSPLELWKYLRDFIPFVLGPSITDFSPMAGLPGTMLEINGTNFSTTRWENEVTVGGEAAVVVQAESNRLMVITSSQTKTGLVSAKVGTRTATSTNPFTILPYPEASAGQDGPPISFEGTGLPSQGDQPSTGTLRVLVALVTPSDVTPSATARQNLLNRWSSVSTFYQQTSYNRLNVQVDVTANWNPLLGNKATYIDASIDNIAADKRDRLAAEAAQGAVNEGFNLNNYGIMCVVICLNGDFIRAWGGGASQNFRFDDDATNTHINITTTNEVNLVWIQESADWGRFAHETGHNLVRSPNFTAIGNAAATLGEDVYASDLVDPAAASAQKFEIMGDHDSHPCFSAYHLDKLGWYNSSNILDLQWDRNSFSREYELVAHGTSENTAGARYHMLRIRVSNGLYYYIEVRQRPGSTSQVFDPNIPVGTAPNQGGIVVYKIISDTINNNQQMRFISLLHDSVVLKQGDVATDPARTLNISVVNDNVQASPLVCRVRVEWAQNLSPDPSGRFDLRIDPWDASYQTPDLWIDRIPFGNFDQPLDSQGRPQGNGDRPKVKAINHLIGRVHNDGSDDAQNVRVTFYTVTPPGVGDNGNWTPLQTKVVSSITHGNFADVMVNWVPILGQHTCLKLYAEAQLGEISFGNNIAQENVFDFQAASGSPADPIILPVTVRNPHKEERLIWLRVRNVPKGFLVHFPHRWVILPGLGEKHLQLTIVPTEDYAYYDRVYRDHKQENKWIKPHAQIGVVGDIPRQYTDLLANKNPVASTSLPIGGVSARVTVMKRVEVQLRLREASKETVVLVGSIKPALANQRVSVDLWNLLDQRWVHETYTDSEGFFNTRFSLHTKPDLDPDESGKQSKGISKEAMKHFKAQAFTMDAEVAADASSNVVMIDL
ncbi:IPT/TIG domain-containing protein [Nostoc sp. CHAB 5784]|uniref:IPT/TIG domain-containing protein n=1 Tax=Nostoc mirabile TaxID=2907820 RepID=UPI001E4A97F4|nr:IPT/TIG domain-containing protein [Nostoc mirabile]MCC5667770.1 IPT/TIG domain-containing protein [Nostoc mirabile CHAB5784]